MAGVANIGSDRDWTRLALQSGQLVRVRPLGLGPGRLGARRSRANGRAMTFGARPGTSSIRSSTMMMGSREAVVDYMTPLGLAPSDGDRPSLWPRPVGRAISRGPNGTRPITAAPTRTASASTAPRPAATRSRNMPRRWRGCFADPTTTPERDCCCGSTMSPGTIGWPSGRTLWAELVAHYDRGVAQVGRQCERDWATLAPYVDAERFAKTAQLSRDPAARGAVVARRQHRLLPECVQKATASRSCAAGTNARIL